MLLPGKKVNRLGIFFFYDAEGVVDDYVTTLLAGFKPFFSELTIVVNGKLTDTSRARLLRYTDADKLIVRENKGFDVWAYKTGLETYGWEKLATFDEVCLFNHTIMGPVYPFSEMFEAMDQRDLDFWGITKFHKTEGDPFGRSPYGYLPEHIQSHFHAYRHSLVTSQAFHDYWDNLPEIKSYYDSVGLHESLFTKRFADKGFKWDVYVNTDDLKDFTYGPISYFTPKLVAEQRCPIFKRRSFFHPYEDLIVQSMGTNVLDLYEFLRDHTDYDTDLIWQNALRTMNLADLMKNLHLDYILPQNIGTALPTDRRIALVMHLYYEESFENNLAYIASMPSTCDVILTVASKAKAMRIRDYCDRHYQNYHIDIRIVENRGRAISALLVAAGKDLLDYDYVCCLEDRKRDMLSPQDVGYGSHSKGFDNTIATKEYVENVIHLFENSPRLGIAMPTPPNHAWYLPNFVYGWAGDLDGAKKLIHETLGLNPLPLDNAKEIIAPLNGAMWFRPQALKPLLGHEWKYEDFPEEPLKPDGTINHAIVRSCAYIAQAEGYFPAYILSDRSARTEITNLAFEDRELIRAISDTWLSYDIEDTKKNIIRGKRLGNTLLRCTRNLVSRIPLIGPSLYHLDWGV